MRKEATQNQKMNTFLALRDKVASSVSETEFRELRAKFTIQEQEQAQDAALITWILSDYARTITALALLRCMQSAGRHGKDSTESQN